MEVAASTFRQRAQLRILGNETKSGFVTVTDEGNSVGMSEDEQAAGR